LALEGKSYVKMTPVCSTTVAAVGYSPARRWLDLRYVKGVTYRYLGVPADVYEALLSARSIGSFVNRDIKGKYPYRLLD
jgi:KTSC domain